MFDRRMWHMNRFMNELASENEEVRYSWRPSMDILEKQNEYYIEADLPGLSKDEISISVEKNVLTIKGERARQEKEENDNLYLKERLFGEFARSFNLHEGVDPEKIEASFSNGVLKVILPKVEVTKPKNIEIQAA